MKSFRLLQAKPNVRPARIKYTPSAILQICDALSCPAGVSNTWRCLQFGRHRPRQSVGCGRFLHASHSVISMCWASWTTTAEPIKIPFWGPRWRKELCWGSAWELGRSNLQGLRLRSNQIECKGGCNYKGGCAVRVDAAFCQITLHTCYYSATQARQSTDRYQTLPPLRPAMVGLFVYTLRCRIRAAPVESVWEYAYAFLRRLFLAMTCKYMRYS